MLTFCCSPENDLYRVLAAGGQVYPRYDSLSEALQAAPANSAVLALADDYPRASLIVDEGTLETAGARGLRLYIEYPASLPGLTLGEPQPTEWERVVVASDFFAPDIQPGEILALHGCWYLPTTAESPHMAVARVAGYHRAVYGLPEDARPILFQLPGRPVLVATSKLSQFVTARYGPKVVWQALWTRLLRWLTGSEALSMPAWEPTVGVQAGRDDPLPASAHADAFARSLKWFQEQIVYSVDWKKGAIEGFESHIDYLGRQKRRVWVRGDCTGETALVLAYDWALRGNPASKHLAGQILDYVWSAPDFRQADPNSPVYGLNNWYQDGPVFYGDDNARVMLPTLAAGYLLGDDRWDEHVLRCLLANLRTTGPLGFRQPRLDYPRSFPDGRGWRYYYDTEVVHYAPHYQAYLWACFLWAYALTGYAGFLERTKNAMRMTMEAYPHWKWTNGLTQEMARMLLPLAFLLRLEDTPEHRGWLERIATDLLAQMQPTGAIYELLGQIEDGSYPSPRSNAEYGTTEASLIQENGDPACDLLYTTNYAFLGLHEAASATGDATLREAEDRLAGFLYRIQVRSKAQPYLDGAWLRSFDDQLWEYWGSSADAGWGAWSAESGWTNAWIASVMAMRHLGRSLFDLSSAERLRQRFPALLAEMLPEEE
ncbi:MAG: hypothetical protein GX552_05105 [Chloroflexi bacterium]|jgi:hypothetical protein|nr:hypothetical protein [Chloroflexota bacterium]